MSGVGAQPAVSEAELKPSSCGMRSWALIQIDVALSLQRVNKIQAWYRNEVYK